MTGKFFTFDGIDGAGKSTQLALFCEYLQSVGHSVLKCRDPGTTALGESVRSLLLRKSDVQIAPTSEMLLYMTARSQLIFEVIEPALRRGQTVVSDRFLLSTLVYQGHAGGVDPQRIKMVGELATTGIDPTATFLLDLDYSTAFQRLKRDHDRMEQRGPAYFEKVRQGFLAEAYRNTDSIVVIDAARDQDVIRADIQEQVQPFI